MGRDIELRHFATILEELFHPSSSLDLGCAQGFLVQHLRLLKVAAYGVDISRAALAQSPEHVRPYLFALDLEKESLPFPSHSMDLITALEVLEHINNLNRVVGEMKRIVRPGGWVFMTSPLPLMNSPVVQLALGRGWRVLDASHVNVHGRRFWKKLFERYRFRYRGTLYQCYAINVLGQSYLTKVLARLPLGSRLRAFLSGAQLFQSECTQIDFPGPAKNKIIWQ